MDKEKNTTAQTPNQIQNKMHECIWNEEGWKFEKYWMQVKVWFLPEHSTFNKVGVFKKIFEI